MALAAKGFHAVPGCLSPRRALKAAEEIWRKHKDASVEVQTLDLPSPSSVLSFTNSRAMSVAAAVPCRQLVEFCEFATSRGRARSELNKAHMSGTECQRDVLSSSGVDSLECNPQSPSSGEDDNVTGISRWIESMQHDNGSMCCKESGTQEGVVDVVILSNGPGEVAAWVRPVVRALRRRFGEDPAAMRISVVLAPCPHASGRETLLIQSFKEIDRCQGPAGFSDFLLWGKTIDNWDWRSRGVCIFLGGDQFNAILTGWRLGYKTAVYAEDAVRWAGLADVYLLRTPSLLRGVFPALRRHCRVIGDLFTDAVADGMPSDSLDQVPDIFVGVSGETVLDQTSGREKTDNQLCCDSEFGSVGARALPEGHLEGRVLRNVIQTANGIGPVVGLLPGSKKVKLMVGVPYMMSVAEEISQRFPGARFVLPLAPTVDLGMIVEHASSATNPMIETSGWTSGRIVSLQDLVTPNKSSATPSRASVPENVKPDDQCHPNKLESNDQKNGFSKPMTEDVFDESRLVHALFQGHDSMNAEELPEMSADAHHRALKRVGNEGHFGQRDSNPIKELIAVAADSCRSVGRNSSLAVGSDEGIAEGNNEGAFEICKASNIDNERDAWMSLSQGAESPSIDRDGRAGEEDLCSSSSSGMPNGSTSVAEDSSEGGRAAVWPGHILPKAVAVIETARGTHILVCQQFPPYELYADCTLCLTTVGTNTAELGSLGVPMVVILPSVGLEVFRGAVGGVLGMLASFPGRMGMTFSKAVNTLLIKSAKFIAWPNRWAQEEIVPELIGDVTPFDAAAVAVQLLMHPTKLAEMRTKLLALSTCRETGRKRHQSSKVKKETAGQASGQQKAPVSKCPGFATGIKDESAAVMCKPIRSGAADALVDEVERLLESW